MTARDHAGRRPAGSRPGDRQPGIRSANPPDRAGLEPMFRADLPASLAAPRQARATVRHALTAWGLDALSADAELITSELVANAAEHGQMPIGLTIRRHTEPDGQHGILCQISDGTPAPVRPQPLQADGERGRGLHLVAALATTSGTTVNPHGKTAWFPHRRARARRQPGFEALPDHVIGYAKFLRSENADTAFRIVAQLAGSGCSHRTNLCHYGEVGLPSPTVANLSEERAGQAELRRKTGRVQQAVVDNDGWSNVKCTTGSCLSISY